MIAMADSVQLPSDGPNAVLATLLLDRPADLDYLLLAKRIGEPLGLDLKMAEQHKAEFPMVLVAGGDLITGRRVDGPFPVPLESVAQFAYWWPDAINEIARSTSFVVVGCR